MFPPGVRWNGHLDLTQEPVCYLEPDQCQDADDGDNERRNIGFRDLRKCRNPSLQRSKVNHQELIIING